MGLTLLNGVVLLAAILGSTLVASQTASPSPRRYPNQNDDYEYDYVEDETTCVNYCRSRLMGTSYCCQPPSAVPVNPDGQLIDCTSPRVDCQGRPRPVPNRPRVYYPRGPRVVDCQASRCDPTPVDVPIQTVVHNPAPVAVPAPNPPVLVYNPRPVVYNVPPPRYVPRRRYYNGQTVVYDALPRYACDQPLCNPVQSRRPTTVVYRPDCAGPRCDARPWTPVSRRRVCDHNSEDLVTAVDQLLLRSYQRAYTMQSFIVGLQSIIDRQEEYSWYGECVAAEVPDYEEPSEEVRIFDDQYITTTAEECHPCSARPTGVRRCTTRFQTILGSCDNCCLTSRTRTRRDAETVVADRPDLREEVARLLRQARTSTRRAFLADLEALVRNATDGRYRWNQTVYTQSREPEARTPSHVESLPPTTTSTPSSSESESGDKSNSNDY